MAVDVHPLHHPLRALNRDVDRRLTELAEAVGLRVDVRHGDTTQAQRAKQTRKPPNLMVTTPETFQLMFSGKNLRAMLSTVQAVVVDEVHDLAASERGWQLGVGLSRLEALTGKPVQRLGLSATVGNPDAVAIGFPLARPNRSSRPASASQNSRSNHRCPSRRMRLARSMPL